MERLTEWRELILNKAKQGDHINRGEDVERLSCLLPLHPPFLFEWEDLLMLTNFEKWQDARHLQIVLGLDFHICHSDLPPRGTDIQLGFSFTSISPLLSCLQHTLLFGLTLGIWATGSSANCYKKHFICWSLSNVCHRYFLAFADWLVHQRFRTSKLWGFWKLLRGSVLNEWKPTLCAIGIGEIRNGYCGLQLHEGVIWMATIIQSCCSFRL